MKLKELRASRPELRQPEVLAAGETRRAIF